MKSKVKFFGIIVMVAVIGFSMSACNNPVNVGDDGYHDWAGGGSGGGGVSSAPSTVFQAPTASGNVAIEIFEENPSRAAVSGNFFVIRLNGTVISRGTIAVSGTVWTFQPTYGVIENFRGSFVGGILTVPRIPSRHGSITDFTTGGAQPAPPQGEQGEQGAGGGTVGTGNFVFNPATGTITGYSGPRAGHLTIPASFGGIPVTAIGASVFAGPLLGGFTGVTIPDSVTSIGDFAFTSNELTSVTIPNSVTTIGNNAFSNNQLTSVTIPNSVTTIGNNAFSNNQLTSVTIPNSVTTIGTSAFAVNRLTRVTIGNSVRTIGAGAFSGLGLEQRRNQLTSVIIPNSVTSIGEGAFRNNQLTSVTIPNSVTSIGGWAFANNQLTGVTIPNSVTSIGEHAFYRNQLTSVTIGNSVTSIGRMAFYRNQLTSVTIPNSVRTIHDRAFYRNQLTSITIGANVRFLIPHGAFLFDGADVFGDGFDLFYERGGRLAGTYTRPYTRPNANSLDWSGPH